MLPLSHLTEENPEGQSGPQSHSKGAMGPGFQPSSGPLTALLYIRPQSSPRRCPSHPGCLPSLLCPPSPAHARGPFRNGGILLGIAFGPAGAPTAALTLLSQWRLAVTPPWLASSPGPSPHSPVNALPPSEDSHCHRGKNNGPTPFRKEGTLERVAGLGDEWVSSAHR